MQRLVRPKITGSSPVGGATHTKIWGEIKVPQILNKCMETKTCTKCDANKPVESFRWRNKSKNMRQSWCKKCFSIHEKEKWHNSSDERKNKHRQTQKTRYRRNQNYVYSFLGQQKCEICGEDDPIVLEFDHINPQEKIADVSTLIYSHSLKIIQEEISKCRVLCANCHRRVTAKQNGWNRCPT